MGSQKRSTKTDGEWRRVLTPEQYRVMREKGTEPPFQGTYVDAKDEGIYACAACGAKLFDATKKYDSGTGWPSFTEPMRDENISLHKDTSRGMERTEAICARCGGHLGHVFDDGPREHGGKRYCINSVSLRLEKRKE